MTKKQPILWLFLCLLLLAPGRLSPQQETAPATDGRAVTRHLNMTFSMPEYRTREEWLTRREFLRKQILFAAGLWPMPEKTPLNPRIFDRLDRNGYTVEKVYFESHPGFYVTGNLYRPASGQGPFPAVLSPHGHWAYGRLQNSESCSVPARCITLARQGYIVLAWDMVGYNDSRQVQHRFSGEREALWGFGSLGLHLWNSIRSVDFLESLPDVDGARLAATGASGGGTQTFLLTAVDDRIAVSSPVNMVSAHMQGGDACENAPNLRIDTNNMEIAAMTAPRPMLLVAATGDWTRNTLEVEYPAIRSIYRLFGAEDRIRAARFDAPHNYNRESREEVYRWFGGWMLRSGEAEPAQERSVRVEFPSDVLVFYGRDLPTEARSEREIAEDFIRRADGAVSNAPPADEAGWQDFRRTFGTGLGLSLMVESPSPDDVRAFTAGIAEGGSFRTERYVLSRTSAADRVPVSLWVPGERRPLRRAVLLLHPDGSRAFEENGGPDRLVRALLSQGSLVLAPDTFNTGRALSAAREQHDYLTTYNRTDAANRIQDILTCLSWLQARTGRLPVKVAGLGEAGLWGLLARALAPGSVPFLLDMNRFEAGLDDAYLKELNIPGIRRAGDVRTAAVVNLDSPLYVHNLGETFPADWIRGVYRSLGKERSLRIEPQPAGEEALLSWLLEDRAPGP